MTQCAVEMIAFWSGVPLAGALSEKYQKRREKEKENVINEFE